MFANAGDAPYTPPAQYITQLDTIGDPSQYIIPNHEQIIGMNQAGQLGLFRSPTKFSARTPAGVDPVFHTHPLDGSPLPSDTDFLRGAPIGEVQYLQTQYGGVLYMRKTETTGVFTEPHTGVLRGTWDATLPKGKRHGFRF